MSTPWAIDFNGRLAQVVRHTTRNLKAGMPRVRFPTGAKILDRRSGGWLRVAGCSGWLTGWLAGLAGWLAWLAGWRAGCLPG